jgi:hypothetical protein
MPARVRFSRPSHGTVVAYLALFVALGGTSAYAANTVFSEDIVDGEVKTPDLADDAVSQPKLRDGAVGRPELGSAVVTREKINNGAVDSTKVADNSLTGSDIVESSLGKVPSAGMADDAGALDGHKASEFAPANLAATIDIPDGGASQESPKTVLGVSGMGEVQVSQCETTGASVMDYGWDNTTSSTDQDVWTESRDFSAADPSDPIVLQYVLQTPATPAGQFNHSGGNIENTIKGTIRVRPVTSETAAVTIHLFAHVDANGECRVSTQAVLSQ